MVPPGRRRTPIASATIILSFLLIFANVASAASAVVGIDIGTEYIKAALVKPGIPLEIVLSKDSKRKEASAVTFKPPRSGPIPVGSFPERLYGGDALALTARFPGEVYPNIKQLLGLPLGSGVVEEYGKKYPALKLVESTPRGTTGFQSMAFHADEKPFAVEELLAMELKNVKENAQGLAGKAHKVANAVFTIPPFYTAEEKKALALAADLAGLNILATISDGLAVGLNYATSRTFPSVSEGGKPEHHLVFDMGAGSTTATVLRMQGKTVKDVGRFNKTIQEVTVLGTGWDRTLGGDALNTIIVDDMISKFLQTPGAKGLGKSPEDVKAHGRAMAKLWKEAERARQVLSANQETVASFEGLYEDVDFRYKLSRANFEKQVGDFADRLDAPMKQALKATNLTFADLDSVILHGGASRTPFVHKKLENLVGDTSKLRNNVNADEAAVFGAAFRAAQISPSFRVKDIVASDAAGYSTYLRWSSEGKDRSQKLFTPTSVIGITKHIPFKQLEDFSFTLYQTRGNNAAGDVAPASYNIETKNLTASVTHLVDVVGCKREDISNTFAIRLDPIMGLPDVVRGSLSCDVEVTEKKGNVVDDVKGFFGFGKKGENEQEPLQEEVEEASSASSTSASSSSSAEAKTTLSAKNDKDAKDNKTAPQPKKKTETVSVDFRIVCDGCKDLPSEDLSRMKQRLAAFDASDKARRAREEDLNNLEGFTYKARDLMTDTSFIEYSKDSERSALETILGETTEWLHNEGQDAPGENLRSRLKDLKALVNPVLKRKSEAGLRPDSLKRFEESLNQTQLLVGVVKDAIEAAEKASATTSSVSEAANQSNSETSTAMSNPTATEATSDPLAELEEEKEPLSSAETASPSSTPESLLSQYTVEDLKEITDLYESNKKWYEEKQVVQEQLSVTDDPAFEAKEVDARSEKLNRDVMGIFQRRIQIPKAKTFNPKPSGKSKSKTKKEGGQNTGKDAESGKSAEKDQGKTKGPKKESTKESTTKSIRDEL